MRPLKSNGKPMSLDDILGRRWYHKVLEYFQDRWRYYGCKYLGHKKPWVERFSGARCARCSKLMRDNGQLTVPADKLKLVVGKKNKTG